MCQVAQTLYVIENPLKGLQADSKEHQPAVPAQAQAHFETPGSLGVQQLSWSKNLSSAESKGATEQSSSHPAVTFESMEVGVDTGCARV